MNGFIKLLYPLQRRAALTSTENSQSDRKFNKKRGKKEEEKKREKKRFVNLNLERV